MTGRNLLIKSANENNTRDDRLEIYENIEFELEKLLDLRKTAGQTSKISSEQTPVTGR